MGGTSREAQLAAARREREEVTRQRHVDTGLSAVYRHALGRVVDVHHLAAGEGMLHAHERVTAADLHGRTGRSDQLECRSCGPRPADLEGRSGLGPFPPVGHGVEQREDDLALAVLEKR